MNNLISMRADGEINKEQFQNMKSEIDSKIHTLQEQIARLMPEESETEEEFTNYNERITVLRYVLESYMNFDSDEDIPEPVIEAFVDKIVVKENSFDWYLFFSGDDNTPKSCNVTGNKKSHKIELLEDYQTLSFVNCNTGCYQPRKVIPKYVKIGEFTLFADDAKNYLYAKSKKRRLLNWHDIHVNVFI